MHIEKIPSSELLKYSEYDNHAEVVHFHDTTTGLRGYIAIHRKRGELSTGGTRYFSYANDEDALRDALRLSAAMTAKCIVAGLPYGGAKGVIIGDPLKDKNTDLLSAYAHVVESLSGAFRTGEDVGMTEEDVQFMIKQSHFFNGKSDGAGDPSPYAALSVHTVMREAVKLHLDGESLGGLRISIKGLGKVGSELARLLNKEKSYIFGSDISEERIKEIKEEIPQLNIVHSDQSPYTPVEIFAPCALSHDIREDNIDRINTQIICGGANNQLQTKDLTQRLSDRGILYVPDFLANAGGVINVSEELEADGYHKERIMRRIDNLAVVLRDCYKDAQGSGIPLAQSVDNYVQAHM